MSTVRIYISLLPAAQDARNSSKIAHQFKMGNPEQKSHVTSLYVHIGDSDCYLGFTARGDPVQNACALDWKSPETRISIVYQQ